MTDTTPALDALAGLGVPFTTVRTERAHSAEESAAMQGIALGALLRTIVVRRGADDYVFVLVPGGRRFDWPKLRTHLGVSRLSLPDADEAKAVTYYTQACKDHGHLGCIRLGLVYEWGIGGVTKDEAKALGYYKAACDAKEWLGCIDLGLMHENAKGGLVKDEAKAVAFYKEACEHKNMHGCAELGRMHAFGKGGLKKDESVGVAFFKEACAAHDELGCAELGEHEYYGRGTAKDEKDGLAKLKEGCAWGHIRWACDDVAKIEKKK